MASASDQKPRLVVLSQHKVEDVRAWSGIPHFAYCALKSLSPQIEVVNADIVAFIIRALSRVAAKFGSRFGIEDSRILSALSSAECSVRLLWTRGDVVIAIAAKPHVYALRTSRPIIYISDATFTGLASLYEWYASWPKWLQADANKVERAALAKSCYVVYPSEWAKTSAVLDYGVPADRIEVTPFGPNFDPNAIEHFKTVKSANFRPNVRLLFVAADWKRKGGVVVLDVKRTLESRGIPCELFLVGDCDPAIEVDATTHVMGRLDKNDPRQLRTLCELYAQAHFFLLPTSAEAFGIVFSEAQAFGCPSLTYAVGGTTSAVKNGETGFTLPLTSPASAFADVIESLVNDPARYETLSANCRRRYENEANWKHWAQRVLDLAGSSFP